MKQPTDIPQSLTDMLSYNPLAGHVLWVCPTSQRVKPMDRAGTLRPDGYRCIKHLGKIYLEHRVAWFMHYGEQPPTEIDHINGVADDNRISNLRAVTHSENMRNRRTPKNNTSGYKNVTLIAGKWTAQIKHLGDIIQIRCENKDSAIRHAGVLRHKLFGQHGRAL